MSEMPNPFDAKINPAPATRDRLMQAHYALWEINLRLHRGDTEFRETIHRLRQETADLIMALDASDEAPTRQGV